MIYVSDIGKLYVFFFFKILSSFVEDVFSRVEMRRKVFIIDFF